MNVRRQEWHVRSVRIPPPDQSVPAWLCRRLRRVEREIRYQRALVLVLAAIAALLTARLWI